MGYSPWGRKESDTTERLHFTSLFTLHNEALTSYHKIMGMFTVYLERGDTLTHSLPSSCLLH